MDNYYTPDGKCHPCEDTGQILEVVREYAGDDVYNLLRSRLTRNGKTALPGETSEVLQLEQTIEDYNELLKEIEEWLRKIQKLSLKQTRAVTHSQMGALANYINNNIY